MSNFKLSSLWNDGPTESTTSSTTFRVSDKKASRRWGDMALNVRSSKSSVCSQLKPYIRNHCTKVLMESQYSSRVRVSTNNGFVGTVIDCYNNHHNLIIRPDDIWTVILTQFSFYINNKAGEFRREFVNFDGKKELLIEIDNSTLTTAPYDLLVTKTTDKIHENLVDKTIKDWIMPNFTTTTPNDTVVCGTIFMAVTKRYFNFGWHLMCGIPYITLEGTLEDWQNISDRLEKLKKYKLDRWYDLLKPILEEFIAAKRNQVNVEFWNRICHHLGGYSGVSLMSGWLTAFAIFDDRGNWTDTSMVPEDPNRIEALANN
ncbi:uncharacterized protein LOC119080492 [Bradysia coprophila]|uniref:uncharacterized protein LOC119080492 n=1 Tax=Bradysia coprophila TaxID=38358 RepID=UPI00187DD054|nr:uncharacterized protein LOC119080492 [Bradysia coprophila]